MVCAGYLHNVFRDLCVYRVFAGCAEDVRWLIDRLWLAYMIRMAFIPCLEYVYYSRPCNACMYIVERMHDILGFIGLLLILIRLPMVARGIKAIVVDINSTYVCNMLMSFAISTGKLDDLNLLVHLPELVNNSFNISLWNEWCLVKWIVNQVSRIAGPDGRILYVTIQFRKDILTLF